MISPQDLESHLTALMGEAVRRLEGFPDLSKLTPALEMPRGRQHGDLATALPLQIASAAHRPPWETAQALASKITENLKGSILAGAIERVEAKPPGFVNFFLTTAFLQEVVKTVLREGPGYGANRLGAGRKALVEFVSANPTGPLSVAHGRQAAVGDALANLLAMSGYQVWREYYLNDEGTQINLLGESILVRAREALGLAAEFPEKGYKGDYITESGRQFAKERPALVRQGGPKAQDAARAFGVRVLTGVIRKELDAFGVRFDRWFAQSSLSRWGFLNRTLNLLKRRGYLYLSEGAWWLKSTAFGDDKDRVVIRSDGRLTYIAADIAYHRRKFKRGFDLLVNLWGPDHHGYIPRLKASVSALGHASDALQIRIIQLCTLKRGAETIPMSTREGVFITLTQVMEEVGRDAARFFFLLRKSDAHLEFDLQLAKQQSLENPVYYIQYAHARITSVLEYQRKQAAKAAGGRVNYERLAAPEELDLARRLREFPQTAAACARALEPFGITVYLQALAEGFHRFYDRHRVVSDDPELTAARLKLIEAVQVVLRAGLNLLGVSAPEKM
ncbi:MAG: arginine--tRNA ligase [Candidatus Omnitrophica bacterium]|nr:arginine--tRNA ligase [Candidatus Omnitrophota bacterium]